MLRITVLFFFILNSLFVCAKTIKVKNAAELKTANSEAKPGDIVILQNGEWNNVHLTLSCTGTATQPILFKAQTPGKVLITGNSSLKIGGTYIIADGLYFVNGFAGNDEVIKFCINKNTVANHCRVTNTVINDFNNPKRLDENYWIALYGKNNRIDHCSFLNKKNMGVLLAVILDDERSRENFHLIDSNYFGTRLPLASNTGETIRVGIAEHCEFNSNTQIVNNYFEHCDGETEIISIKSGNNIIRNNLFKECQGTVVLRHGNFNTVENNVFLGNNKPGTGGVRIINKGQWVVNNFFYQCRGDGFRSPLSIMNGVPNSPAKRYVAVTDAVVSNNSFVECTPISFCEGSDAERSVWPQNVEFLNNLFYNTKDRQLYNVYDTIDGFFFNGNLVSKTISQQLANGFSKTSFRIQKAGVINLPTTVTHLNNTIADSLYTISRTRLVTSISNTAGVVNLKELQNLITTTSTDFGAKWFNNKPALKKQVSVNCKNAAEVLRQLTANNNNKLTIHLTGRNYVFSSPLNITNDVLITTIQKQFIKFSLPVSNSAYCIKINAGNTLQLTNLKLDLSSAFANTFITTDTSGNSNHCNFSMSHCDIINSSGIFFKGAKSSVSDSIIINRCSFSNGKVTIFKFAEETDKKGYYNVEKLKIINSIFSNYKGQLLAMLRSGTDESTMGPKLIFVNNKVNTFYNEDDAAVINIYGIQRSFIEKNIFTSCNEGKILIQYEDKVRAEHFFRQNSLNKSGRVISNKFLVISF
jgi:poly(beta-D-mannuronate) lyase